MGSEMAYLFFNELGNKAVFNASGTGQSGYGVTNAGPFQNHQSHVYWPDTEYAPIGGLAWSFYTGGGRQDRDEKNNSGWPAIFV